MKLRILTFLFCLAAGICFAHEEVAPKATTADPPFEEVWCGKPLKD